MDVVPLPSAPDGPVGATVLCCECSAPISGALAGGARCAECLKLSVDASAGVQREAVLHTCGDCGRSLSPPSQWLTAAPESRELLALCLKKLRGLARLRVVDASFVWTEPHSRRIKVKITVQQEAFPGAIVQQSFEVEFVVANQQCPDCRKSYTHHSWRAVVQTRQKVPHKRTFLFLEQLILRHGAHHDAINIKEVHDGIDFYFGQRNQAEKFVDFLHSVTPIHLKKSQQLISEDIHTSTKQYKFTFSVEIVPVCKEDLIALPLKLAKESGNISPLVLCHRIGTAINILDPQTLQTADISARQFWHTPFRPIASVADLVEYIVLDIEPLPTQKGRLQLAEATVAPASDMDKNYYVRTHLGALLHPGDSALGFDLSGRNFNSSELDAVLGSARLAAQVPDVVLVKKHYPRHHRKARARQWRLRRMEREEGEVLPRKQDRERDERDYEMFLRDVEEDEEMRAGLNLYKQRAEEDAMEVESSVGDGNGLKVPMEELLDDFEEMNIRDEHEKGLD